MGLTAAGRRLAKSRKVGLVGTYPPTRGGIAAFTASLADALTLAAPGCRVGVIECVEGQSSPGPGGEVVARLSSGSASSLAEAVSALEQFDVAIVQHEFGIYGGVEGSEVLDLLRALHIPSIVVLHTVLRRPIAEQRLIVEEIGGLADRLVVQSTAARARLLELYAVDERKVRTIPHGARLNLAAYARSADGAAPVVLTWGFLNRDKGVEWAIEAMAMLDGLEPAPRYVVAGQTHPRVLGLQGEEYRESLLSLASQLGIADRVELDGSYCDTDALLGKIREADIILLPYNSREQVVSAVLVEALASGKPVVATRFPHAEELLGGGAGLLVPHEDAAAIAVALYSLLTNERLATYAAASAARIGRSLAWESIGERYHEVVSELVRPPHPRFEHLLAMSDDKGVFEHARRRDVRRDHGYCTDDVARALVALMREPERSPGLERLAETCLSFLERAQLPDGRFHNRLSADGAWVDAVGSDDATGCALWAAGTAAARATSGAQRARAQRLLQDGVGFRSACARANAFAVLGSVEVTDIAYGLLVDAADGLGAVSTDPGWPWPEPRLTYANAVLAEARIAAGVALEDGRLVEEGLELLTWLAEKETHGDHFSFTPAAGWAPGEPRPGFDQRPIEAGAMADACARALTVTGDPEWAERVVMAAEWFLGRNDVDVPLVDPASGGCRDGLERDGVNENEGAESTIALITALQQARRIQAAARSPSSSGSVSTVAVPTQQSAAGPYIGS
jgi:glycosyltransferase involved in cell wall biosynthesis